MYLIESILFVMCVYVLEYYSSHVLACSLYVKCVYVFDRMYSFCNVCVCIGILFVTSAGVQSVSNVYVCFRYKNWNVYFT